MENNPVLGDVIFLREIERFYKQGKNIGKRYLIHEMRCFCGKVFVRRASSKSRSCGCFTGEFRKGQKLGPHPSRIRTPEIARLKVAQRVYEHHGYSEADISFDDFLALSQMNCHYCNTPPSNKRHLGLRADGTPRKIGRWTGIIPPWGSYLGDAAFFIYNGLDRLDSSRNHSKDNVVPCCKRCNWTKGSRPMDEFLAHVTAIAQHLKLIKQQ